MIRIALLDDHPAVLTGLCRLVDSEPDLLVVAAAMSAPELARRLEGLRPDVLVLDDDLAHGDGLTHCRRIKSRPASPGVIVYSAYASPALALAARAAQADGLVDKSSPVGELVSAIRRVAAGAEAIPEVPREIHDAAVRRIEDEDLPILAMLLQRESVVTIADTLRREPSEIAWRAQRIVGRLRPATGSRGRPEPSHAG